MISLGIKSINVLKFLLILEAGFGDDPQQKTP